MDVMRRDVTMRMADGTADGVLCVPAGEGRWPAVLVWADIGGLRETFVGMARRLAAEGYAVLVPNLFYRRGPAPQPEAKPDFSTEAGIAEGMELLGSLSAERVRGDARSYFGFLDGQAEVDPAKPAGVVGYCMGGALAFWTAGVLPGRVGALATFHAGRLVREDDPNSPDRAIETMRVEALVAVAEGDEAKEPRVREVLTQAFAKAGLPARVEVFAGAQHGWCVPDGRTYNEALAERAWGEMLELFGRTLR